MMLYLVHEMSLPRYTCEAKSGLNGKRFVKIFCYTGVEPVLANVLYAMRVAVVQRVGGVYYIRILQHCQNESCD